MGDLNSVSSGKLECVVGVFMCTLCFVVVCFLTFLIHELVVGGVDLVLKELTV